MQNSNCPKAATKKINHEVTPNKNEFEKVEELVVEDWSE
jgi:hypothetical protein